MKGNLLHINLKGFAILILAFPIFGYSQDSSKLRKLALKYMVPDSFPQGIRKSPLAIPQLTLPEVKSNSKVPFISVTGANLNYSFNYRSYIDTPFYERNLGQHQLYASFTSILNGIIPVKTNVLVRRSNSDYFRNVFDIQISLDHEILNKKIFERAFQQNLERYKGIQDSIVTRRISNKLVELKDAKEWIGNPLTRQKLLEAYEIIKVPELSYRIDLPDSMNQKIADSAKAEAQKYIALYNKKEIEYAAIKSNLDSLKNYYEGIKNRLNSVDDRLEALKSGQLGIYDDSIKKLIPPKLRWLLHVKRASLGRSPISASELTAKNININGFNLAYNSWYYLGLMAGIVDFRFRDFGSAKFQKSPQYFSMLRFGIGRLENNYIILSAFHGRKQLFTSSSSLQKMNSIDISGISAETKWQISRYSYLISEVAQSQAPDFRKFPDKHVGRWSLMDKDNKALSLRFSSYFPVSGSRIEAKYKFTGANYQAFQSFQTNAQTRSWLLKLEQNLLGRKIKLTGSISANDFSNPYLVQGYNANTIFKTLNLTLRFKKFPIVSIGYLPTSQLTLMNGLLTEYRFQTFTGSLMHFYKIGQANAATNLVYSRFFNDQQDTSFLYFNSTNVFVNQSFFFSGFTLNMILTHSYNSGYQNNVVEEGISFPFQKRGNISFGTRMSILSGSNIKVGGYLGTSLPLFETDMINIRIDKNYLPSGNGTLVPNLIGSISFVKMIK